MGLVRCIYSAMTWAAQPLLRRKLRRRAQQEPGYAHAVPERFGHYVPENLGREAQGQWVWIHAVSLGETRAAAILIAALRAQWPQMRLLLTHSTATGREAGKALLRTGDVQVWLPWDTQGATARFLAQFRPWVGVLMETEVWPNLLAQCQRAQVPVVLANARLNEKSLAGALRWHSLAVPAYQSLGAVWPQTAEDASRFAQLQAPVQGVWGNLKFDVELPAALLAQGARWRAQRQRPVLLLASSREGEEAQWLQAWQATLAHHPERAQAVQWLIVPRHPQRFDAVAELLAQAGLRVGRRSTWTDAVDLQAEVWLGDSVGEMALYYAMADVGLLGGSFEKLGGQNLIEAAAGGCPMVLGPYTFNFAQAAQDACRAGAAVRVADMTAAVETALALTEDTQRLHAMKAQAHNFATAHRGAAQATARAIIEIATSQRGDR